MQTSSQQFQTFADNLYSIFKEFEQRANDPSIDIESQMMWAISANLVVKIAASAHAASINHEGTKQ